MGEAVLTAPDFSAAGHIAHNAWMAVICSFTAVLMYILGLLCAHFNAFHIATNIRIRLMRHITFLPPGEKNRIGSGALRRIVSDSSMATETYLAHQLPDMVGAYVTPLGLVVLLFAFDWRFGLICLIPGSDRVPRTHVDGGQRSQGKNDKLSECVERYVK